MDIFPFKLNWNYLIEHWILFLSLLSLSDGVSYVKMGFYYLPHICFTILMYNLSNL